MCLSLLRIVHTQKQKKQFLLKQRNLNMYICHEQLMTFPYTLMQIYQLWNYLRQLQGKKPVTER